MKDSSTGLSVSKIKGVGPHRARLLSKLNITTAEDAFHYLPLRYEDHSSTVPLGQLRPGAAATVSGDIVAVNIVRPRGRGLAIFEAIVSDGSSFLKLKWFNQAYMAQSIRTGLGILATGMVKPNRYGMPPLEMDSPEHEILSCTEEAARHLRVLPVYGLTEGISQKQFRKIMSAIISGHASEIEDHLPGHILRKYSLPPLAVAIREVHFPSSPDNVGGLNSGTDEYHRRLIFDELFLFELGMARMKKISSAAKGISFRPGGRLRKELLKMLPYSLTSAQNRVISEIEADMRSEQPMQRLIQGDVGCGKTVVALAAMLDAVESGYQAILMAPTEILAGQHFLNIRGLAEGLGLRPVLLTGSSGQEMHDKAAEADIVVGTHALIQEKVTFSRLGLVVIDEQHKFGVTQRVMLRKKGPEPDVLVMTATPIPRTLALSLFGDLDLSVIDELPPGRKSVSTRWVLSSDRENIYPLLLREVSKGRQAYVVYPAIEESENADLKSAVTGRDAFEKKFPELRVGLLHGRMGADERAEVMGRFRRHEIDLLVSTTVIEVGVDVPNATLMLIVHAERFGLSQLHQLRGRVGRGTEESFCILIAYEPVGTDARRRLDIMALTDDGFRIAEEDLAIRGAGDFFGTRQAGMPDLKHADMARDIRLLEAVRNEAFGLIDADPELEEYPSLKKRVDVFWKGKADLFRTG